MSTDLSPALKLAVTILVALALAIPLFSVWLLVYDRQAQSETAQRSIAEGWGGPQIMSGPVLVIPYRYTEQETVTEDGRQVTRTVERLGRRILAPVEARIDTRLRPERRARSIYEAIVYDAAVAGRARFALPPDIARYGVDPAGLDLAAAELRFGLSDPRGLGANPRVQAGGVALPLQPGGGSAAGGSGFFAWLDARALAGGPIEVAYAFDIRGNRSLSLAPQAGDTWWRVQSPWPHPSFLGSFLPTERSVAADGFSATYRVGNLALGQSLIGSDLPAARTMQGAPDGARYDAPPPPPDAAAGATAEIALLQPVDLYSQVDRAAKYGFLFIGFTFLAFLLFDVVGGVRVSAVEYLLVGAGLILFFVMLLAFAEVIGFTLAYVAAAGAITGLITFYSAAVLKSWRRAWWVAALLAALYATLYLLLSLEAFSLLIGSLLLFAALAATMYLTRNLRWGARGGQAGGDPAWPGPVAEPPPAG
jgi:inner membrane protein